MTAAEEILPIGSSLSNLSVQTINRGDLAEFNLIVLTFIPTYYLVLQSIADTNQISISPWLSHERNRGIRLSTNPNWAQSLVGKKLTSAWVDDDESDRQQIVFAFDNQILSLWAKDSVLKVSLQEKVKPNPIPIKQKLRVGFHKIRLIKKDLSLLG